MNIFKKLFGIERIKQLQKEIEYEKEISDRWYNSFASERSEVIHLRSEASAYKVLKNVVSNWSVEDIFNLKKFLSTETGQKFISTCGAKIQAEMLEACNDPMHTTHSAAKCAGADALLRWQFNLASDVTLSQITSDTGDKNPVVGQQDESDPLNILRPEIQQD